ncbi:MAG: hypothetical protein GX104_07920 [Spirochaetales bacterium]|nr:hypothetical protein [Spirochaetales bacterium]
MAIRIFTKKHLATWLFERYCIAHIVIPPVNLTMRTDSVKAKFPRCNYIDEPGWL